MGTHDPPGGLTHFVGEGAYLQEQEFDGSCGLGRYYCRTTAAGGIDGRHLLVRVDCSQPTSSAPPCYGGNIFAKGDVVLGRETSGPHSVHLGWNIRNTFMKNAPGCGCSCAAPSYYQWNDDLYYARPRDGGFAWESLAVSRVRTVADPSPFVVNQPPLWNDSGCLVDSGEVNQTSERSFDVDRNGNPVLVIKALVLGTGTYWPNRQTGHLDNAGTVRPPSYALVSRHWNGTQWIESVIDGTRDFFNDWVRCAWTRTTTSASSPEDGRGRPRPTCGRATRGPGTAAPPGRAGRRFSPTLRGSVTSLSTSIRSSRRTSTLCGSRTARSGSCASRSPTPSPCGVRSWG